MQCSRLFSPFLGKLFFVSFFLTETAWHAEWFSVVLFKNLFKLFIRCPKKTYWTWGIFFVYLYNKNTLVFYCLFIELNFGICYFSIDTKIIVFGSKLTKIIWWGGGLHNIDLTKDQSNMADWVTLKEKILVGTVIKILTSTLHHVMRHTHVIKQNIIYVP